MPYVVVDNFSAGLDSRRHVLNSKSGTLSKLVNAHVTRGGEIEKRKAFVQFADLTTMTAVGDDAGPTLNVDSYGLEATAEGLYVFGSEPNPTTTPAGVIYQRLQHPVSANFVMEKVVFSTVYGGKPFVIAQFSNIYNSDKSTIAFYDGVAVKDWYEGFVFEDYPVTDVASKLSALFPANGYTATPATFGYAATPPVTGPTANQYMVIDVSGPVGKPFTMTANMDAPLTSIVTKIQSHKETVPETTAKGYFSITGGSESAAQIYKTGVNLDAATLPGIRSIRVAASSATAANGVDLIGWTGATGLKFDTVTPPYATGGNCGALFYNIAKAINDNTTAGLAHGYSAVSYRRAENPGNDTNDLIIYAPASQGATANGVLLQIEFDANPTGIGNLSELINTATIAVSPYSGNPRHIATCGTFSGGTFNRITSVKVNGVEVLGTPVAWSLSHGATAEAVATQINSYTSSTEYVASVIDGSRVMLSGVVGTGSIPNGRVIEVLTEGNVVLSGLTSLAGGVSGVAGLPQISRLQLSSTTAGPLAGLGGPVPFGTKYALTIINPDNPTVPIIVGASRVAGKKGAFSATYKSKEYVGSGSTLYFSAVNDATKWDIYDTGSGFIDMSNNFGGREDLTGVGVYQNYLAVFSRRNVQLWSMDADPAQNSQVQVLANTGSIAPDSVVSVGSIDLLYLADNGVRSVRARENTDTAYASDIGSPIDSIIIDHMAANGDAKFNAKAVIEPIDGRYWLAIGNKIFVLSYFSGSNISAWSSYELNFTVAEMVSREDKVYVRDTNNKIYVYGGTAGTTYDSSQVVIELPYLDANKPATYKEVKGVDMTCNGEWKVYLGFDHTNPTARDLVATVTQSTFALGKITATGAGTHLGPRFVNQAAGPALIANFIVHYDEMHSKHDAG